MRGMLFAALLALYGGPASAVGFEATPEEDNTAIFAALLTNGALFNAAVSANVFDPTAGFGTFATAWALQNTLRVIPPFFEPPDSLDVRPTDDLNFDGCTFQYDLPVNEASYTNFLGFINLGLDDDDWGLFDAPFVQHWDSSVAVRLSGLDVGTGVEIGGGRYGLQWQAATQYSVAFDIIIPPLVYYAYNKLLKPPAQTVTKNALVEVATRAVALGSSEAGEYLDLVDDNPDEFNPWVIFSTDSAINRAERELTVWDIHPPYFRDAISDQRISQQDIFLEARDFGGTRFSRVKDELESRFTPYDECGRPLQLAAIDPPSLIPISTSGVDLEWRVSDGGPYDVTSPNPGYLLFANHTEDQATEDVYATLRQRIFVVDTQAPLLVVPEGIVGSAESRRAPSVRFSGPVSDGHG